MFNSVSMDDVYINTLQAYKNREIKKELDKEAFFRVTGNSTKNQDPTEPLDNKDLLIQLSQLSSTEQIMNMSNAVQEMVNSQLALNKLQAVSLLGKEVVVNSNVIKLESGGVAETINFGLDNDSEVIVEIYDTNGNLVSSQNLGVKTQD